MEDHSSDSYAAACGRGTALSIKALGAADSCDSFLKRTGGDDDVHFAVCNVGVFEETGLCKAHRS
jgi:hypothetical protein